VPSPLNNLPGTYFRTYFPGKLFQVNYFLEYDNQNPVVLEEKKSRDAGSRIPAFCFIVNVFD